MIKEVLPPSLRQDENITKLVEVFDNSFTDINEKVQNVLIYSRIDELPEELLDLLAWQFHIEGYELANSLEEKRNLLKNAIQLHRYKGTKYALLKVLETLNLQGNIQEWYEYNGEPYRFKVDVGISNKELTPELIDKLINLINEYKNERSLLEELIATYLARGRCFTYSGTMAESWGATEMIDKFEWQAQGRCFTYFGTTAELYATAIMEA
ncbi:phage tail protein I [Sulfurihydrogenibium sp.]|uniref:phage tail protein I n=1 Tax=Sulfurihydrogenibium sp. TaxID=2053621 RepID=UPI00260CD7AF|nr:phage tail protein I [Sulfurihydrogenibium sp.]